MQTLPVDRKIWDRGRAGGELFNSETGKYCILGFFGKMFFDLTDKEMDRCPYISDALYRIQPGQKTQEIETRIENFTEKFCPKFFVVTNSLRSVEVINDDPGHSEPDRELHLTRSFRKHFNIELEFTG